MTAEAIWASGCVLLFVGGFVLGRLTAPPKEPKPVPTHDQLEKDKNLLDAWLQLNQKTANSCKDLDLITSYRQGPFDYGRPLTDAQRVYARRLCDLTEELWKNERNIKAAEQGERL